MDESTNNAINVLDLIYEGGYTHHALADHVITS